MITRSDIEAVQAAYTSGDQDTLKEFALKARKIIRHASKKYSTGHERDDLVQDALARAMIKIKDFKIPENDVEGKIHSWLVRITRNMAVDRLEHKRLRVSVPHEGLKYPNDGDVSAMDHSAPRDLLEGLTDENPKLELERLLQKARVRNTTPGAYDAYRMTQIEGTDAKTAGQVLGVDEGTVRTRTHRFLTTLRDVARDDIER